MLRTFRVMSRIPKQIKIEALASVYPFLSSSKRAGIFMWHHGRCGSTVLGRLLKQHPDIRWYGEIFEGYAARHMHRAKFRDDIKYVQVVSGKKSPGIEIKGLPCQHLHNLGVSLQRFVEVIRQYGFSHCVLLHRQNILRKLISVQIVDQGLRSSYHLVAGSKEELQGRLKIDLQRVRILGKYAPLLDMIQYIDEETDKARQVLSEYFNILPLFYEDDIQDNPLIAYRKVCEHLQLEDHNADVTLRRINSKTLRELVENSNEIEDLLSGTPYEWMLTT
jgi:hypothetical protein